MSLFQTKLVSLSVALTLMRIVFFLLLILVKDMKNVQMRVMISFGARQSFLTIQQILLTTQTLLSGETVVQIAKLKVSTANSTFYFRKLATPRTLTDFRLKCVIIITSKSEIL